MAVSVTQTVSAQLERVHPKVQNYIDTSENLHALFKKAGADDGITVSRYLYRVPWKRYQSGVLSKYANDGGAYPTGDAPTLASFTAGYFTFALAYQLTQEMIDTMESDTQARVNIMTDTIQGAIQEMDIYMDIFLHGDGTGKLTNAASTGTATTLVFAGTTDYLGVKRVRPGSYVDVWDSTGVTKRANGPYKVASVDWPSKTVTFATGPTGIATTDLLTVAGLDSYGPSAPTSFSATWPASGLTNGPGLDGDSFIHGIAYSNDATDGNYFLGKLKSTYPELKSVAVSAANNPLTFQHGILGLHQLIERRGKEIAPKLRGIAPLSAAAQQQYLGMAISNWPNNNKPVDQAGGRTNYTDTFDFCGISCILSNRQAANRFDFVSPDNFRRIQTKPIGFVKNPDGSGYLHPTYSNPSGTTVSRTAGVQFWVSAAMDYACFDPGASFYISGFTPPDGYV